MNPKNIARIMGVLYLVGTVAGILSRVLTAPALGVEDVLFGVAANSSQIVLAALLVMNFVAGLLVMFGVFSPVSEASTFLQLPIFLQEVVLAIWLIVKGFNPKAVTQ